MWRKEEKGEEEGEEEISAVVSIFIPRSSVSVDGSFFCSIVCFAVFVFYIPSSRSKHVSAGMYFDVLVF